MLTTYNNILTKLAQQDPVTEEELQRAKNMATLGRLLPIPVPGKSDAITALGAPEGRRMDTVIGANEGGRLGAVPGAAIGALGGSILGGLGGRSIARKINNLTGAISGDDLYIAESAAPVLGAALGGSLGVGPGMMVGDAIGARAGIENKLREKRPGVPMDKEAMIEVYAPETGYIPAKYMSVLNKQASIEKSAFLGALGKTMTSYAGKNIGNMAKGGLVRNGALTASGASGGLMQQAKNYGQLYGNRAIGYAGKQMQNAGKFVADKGTQLANYGVNYGKQAVQNQSSLGASAGSLMSNVGKTLQKATV